MHTARPPAGTKKNRETTENTEHAEKQIGFFREFRSCQELIVVERLSGNVFQLFAVSNTDNSGFAADWFSANHQIHQTHEAAFSRNQNIIARPFALLSQGAKTPRKEYSILQELGDLCAFARDNLT